MEFRSLDPSEREELLALLDGWGVGDGWRSADFFRRYLEDDPTFEERNVHVAVEDGRLLSCVQVFPRPVSVRGVVVPMGGIGSVFTHPSVRKRGLGEALLARAADDMRSQGMLLSLLFAGRPHWYAKLGWVPVGSRNALLRPSGSPPAPSQSLDFDAARDLEDVRALHARYSGALDGPVVRDADLWQASLANAGNPDERFRVVREGGRVVAYLRSAVLSGFRVLLELGCEPDARERLCAEIAHETEELLVAPALGFDPALRAGLEGQGIAVQEVDDPRTLWRCLDAPALAERLGLPPEPAAELVARLFPAGTSVFWTADRF